MVVAPIHLNSPLAKAGLRRLEASIAPPAAPAPTTVCISSMKRTISPSLLVTSSNTARNRSSNSPRILAPAMRAPMSNATSLHGACNPSGTSPATMRCAIPSATAVFPVPGSPSRMGLFLLRRDKIWMARRVSSSRPMTGSSFPSRAACVRSLPYFIRASYVLSDPRESAGPTSLRCFCTAARTASYFTSCFFRAGTQKSRSSLARARTSASTLTYESPSVRCTDCASPSTLLSVRLMFLLLDSDARGILAMWASRSRRSRGRSTPAAFKIFSVTSRAAPEGPSPPPPNLDGLSRTSASMDGSTLWLP
mmetsp:Transcript_15619/g.35152  ORF Transcript_15619/g.35152 Transcript_15619/m.35152 type:complete len:308 (-) Transcript_15619:520-1443(-)